MAFVTSTSHVVDVLPTRAKPCVHVGHLGLHQLTPRDNNQALPPHKFSFIENQWLESGGSHLKFANFLTEGLSHVQVWNSMIQHCLHDAGDIQTADSYRNRTLRTHGMFRAKCAGSWRSFTFLVKRYIPEKSSYLWWWCACITVTSC